MKFAHVFFSMAALASVLWAAPSSAAMTEAEHTLRQGWTTRTYLVNKPSSCTVNCPVVIDMHGYTSNAVEERDGSGQLQVGDANGYIVVYPSGRYDSWNAGSSSYGTCCGTAERYNVDDVGFLKAMIAKIKTDYPMIDPKRIYATGISNGCAMSQRLAAEASDIIAGAACSSHYLLTTATSLKRPINMTEIHGLSDILVSYNRSFINTGAQDNFKRWAKMNGCTGLPTKTAVTVNSHVEEYSNCSSGVKVKLYTLKSGHVTYTNTDGVDVAKITWDALKTHSLP
ncbi:MAG: hypothetical protein A3I66_03940 [Burkholderiales bacterium RIFCSPLOWO2_02_FULL_57_36]|nr:MAG: hypothetical protein A3I66_03940 [Burkholderiales bacterium RIFCSPLOWO2_02_FULL_57_36]